VSEKIRPYHVEIQNVVAVASLGQKMDLVAITKIFSNVEYRPRKFPGLVFKLKKLKTTTLIFSTGKMVCTGAKSEKEAFSEVRKVVRELKNKGFIIPGRPEIEIVNIVASADVGSKVDLEETVEVLDKIIYEPEQFPGAIYRMEEPRVVLLIFTSGKLVITGAKREEQVHEAADKMRSILVENELLY
jgi:transcription initiation factor TFIID TATA-box-binding protein